MKGTLTPNFQLYGTAETTEGNLFFSILRIGQETSKLAKTRYSSHRHTRLYEVVWLTSGQLTLTIDESSYTLGPDTFCLIAPGSVHESVASPDFSSILLHFSADFLLSGAGEAGSRLVTAYHGGAPQHIVSAATAGRIRGVFERIEEEFVRPSQEKNALIRHYLHILLLELQRETGQGASHHPDDAGRLLTSRFADLVEQHYATKKQVSDYAELLHLTPNYLNAVIKHTTGHTAGHFIRDRVILEAKRLLLFSEASVSEVAYALNYDDVSYFWRLFKKVVHVSPTEFKKRGHQL